MSNDSKSVGIDWTNEEAVRAAHPGAYRTPSGKVIVWEPKIIGCVQKILIKADGWGEARKHSSVVAFESVNRPEAKADHTVCAEAYMDAIEAERDAALAELAKEKGLREQAEKHCAIERKALDSAYSEMAGVVKEPQAPTQTELETAVRLLEIYTRQDVFEDSFFIEVDAFLSAHKGAKNG